MKITIEIAEDEVLVALKRPEGYEDVHPEIVASDALKGDGWKGDGWLEYRTIHWALPEPLA